MMPGGEPSPQPPLVSEPVELLSEGEERILITNQRLKKVNEYPPFTPVFSAQADKKDYILKSGGIKSMRLNPYQTQSIISVFHEVFQEGDLYLFGSRTDDSKSGGDIDLYLSLKEKKDWLLKKIDFLIKLKRKIGDQKIDLVADEGKNRPIDREARKQGICLCRF